ncbi:MAG: hypothetical protein OEV66_03605 [Spirochaetia bacterium]|nr:hypothetical protein [Spirochaetia bacterium]
MNTAMTRDNQLSAVMYTEAKKYPGLKANIFLETTYQEISGTLTPSINPRIMPSPY